MDSGYSNATGLKLPKARYRPKRHRVRDFLESGAMRLEIEGVLYRIRDISMNGSAVQVGKDQRTWPVDSRVKVHVLLHDEVVYKGLARVVRIDQVRRGQRMGIELLDAFLDLPALRWQHEERLLDKSFEENPSHRLALVPKSYRLAVNHAAYFVERYRRILTHHENRYRELGRDGRAYIDELGRRAYEHLREPWNLIRLEAAAASRELMKPNAKKARYVAKEFTETVLTPLLLDAPAIERAYTKPLGYPGDFKTMGYIYEKTYEGSSVFGRVMHRLSVDEPHAEGVRNRKIMVEDFHKRVAASLDGLPPGEPFRVTSIASGPALEVVDLVKAGPPWKRSTHWTLVDIEENALSLAYANIHAAIREKGAAAELRCFHTSFTQFLSTPLIAFTKRRQHFIYASGLFDYIADTLAATIVGVLYDHLEPGGLLSIGNAFWPNEHFWFTEYVIDWRLIYRTREQVLAMAREIKEPAEIEVEIDDTGSFQFLNIRKPRR